MTDVNAPSHAGEQDNLGAEAVAGWARPIIAAAIKFGDVICFVPAPGRHHNVLHGLHNNHSKRTKGYDTEVQGFLTAEGQFLTRREAFLVANACGQMKRREGGYNGDDLYSEDLW